MKISAIAAAFAVLCMTAFGALAQEGHRLVIHVDENDPAVMNMALNNADNVRSYYADAGEDVTIEIVAYGPGLNMLVADSPVKERIAAMSLENPDMQFSACGNTMAGMAKKLGHDVELVSEATVVKAGVVRIMELQEQGYAYVRP